MPTLKNQRWEIFARALAEGQTATAAHTKAGYKPNPGNPMRLKAIPAIQARVEELKQMAVAKTTLTKAWLLEQMKELFLDAKKTGNFTAANRTGELLGREVGLFTETKNISWKPLSQMTADELLAFRQQAIEETAGDEDSSSYH